MRWWVVAGLSVAVIDADDELAARKAMARRIGRSAWRPDLVVGIEAKPATPELLAVWTAALRQAEAL